MRLSVIVLTTVLCFWPQINYAQAAAADPASCMMAASSRDSANIRLIHLSPDSPAFDVWVNRAQVLAANVAYSTGTTYTPVIPAVYTIDLVPAGGTIDQSVLTLNDVTIESGIYYTGVAYNLFDNIKAVILTDMTPGEHPGEILPRAVHAAVGYGEVDIWNVTTGAPPSALWTDLGYGSFGDYQSLPVSAFTLGFDFNNDGVPDSNFAVPQFPDSTICSVFLVAGMDGVSFLMFQFVDGSLQRIDLQPPAKLRPIHLSPDAPTVDVYDGAYKIFANLSFLSSAADSNLTEFSHALSVIPLGGSPADALLNLPAVPLVSNLSYTLAFYDAAATMQGMVLLEDAAQPQAGNIRLRAVHTAAGNGALDIALIPETGAPVPLWTDLSYGSAGLFLDEPAASFRIGIDRDADATPDFYFTIPALADGSIIDLFILSDSANTLFLAALHQDDTVTRIDPDTCTALGVALEMPAEFFSPGDTFFATATVCNPATEFAANFVSVLEVLGYYYFYPSWTQYPPDVDSMPMTVNRGTTVIHVIEPLAWPDTGLDTLSGINLYGAILDEGMTRILGDYDVATFGYGPS